MMKRKAETLIEIVTAMTLFGIIMSGLFDFMANQTLNIARIKDRETIIYYAQKWFATGGGDIPEAKDNGVKFLRSDSKLTVTLKNNTSMVFSLE